MQAAPIACEYSGYTVWIALDGWAEETLVPSRTTFDAFADVILYSLAAKVARAT
jgi:hypothetical protein